MAYMEDGNKGGPPISRYIVCGQCRPQVRSNIEQLEETITGLRGSLKEWKNELRRADTSDDYAYVVRCQEEIQHLGELLNENELMKDDLKISLEGSN